MRVAVGGAGQRDHAVDEAGCADWELALLELIDRSARLQWYLEESGLADGLRRTGLLGFVSPNRHPELLDSA